MIQATEGARPRLLAAIIGLLALIALAPWLHQVQWRGEGVEVVEAVRSGRPFAIPDRAGYVVLGMAAESLLPGRTSFNLNCLGLAAGVLGTLAIARFRSVLARGGTPLDRLLEPVATALALLAAGPWVVRSLSADSAGAETLLGGIAASLAWTGRLSQATWVASLLGLVSSRSVALVPILFGAPRVRGDLRAALWPLAIWVATSLVRLPGPPPGGELAPSLADDGLRLAVGLGGLAPLAAFGAVVGLARGGPHRRYVLAVLASGALLLALAGRAGLLEALVPLLPFAAVLAGGGLGSIRRAAARTREMALGPAAVVAALLLLAVGLLTTYRFEVAPIWRRAQHHHDDFRAFAHGLNRPYHLAAGWPDRQLLDLALGFALPPWERLPIAPLADRIRTHAEQAELDARLKTQDILLLQRLGQAVPLPADDRGLAQLLKSGDSLQAAAGAGAAPATRPSSGPLGLAEFGRELVLERMETVLAGGRTADNLITFRLHWRAAWPAGGRPRAARGPLRVAMRIVDASGRVRLDLTHWLIHGLYDLPDLGARQFEELIVGYLPRTFQPGDYGVEVGVYEVRPGEAAAHELELWGIGEAPLPVVSRGVPLGVTREAVRGASFRLEPRLPLF
jgi:hypothetical protein